MTNRIRAAALAGALVLAACGRPAAQAPRPQAPRPEAPKPATAVSPMGLGGQKVLILPLQSSSGLNVGREQVTAEVIFALGEWDSRTPWVTPDQLRAAMRRAPGYAPDPASLPRDPMMHHGERYVVEPLAGLLRRYTALMDTRLVLVLREARWLPNADATSGVVRLNAAVIDSRAGNLIWWGEADGETATLPDQQAVATAAAALAARMVTRAEN
jgi:hypothetical protein